MTDQSRGPAVWTTVSASESLGAVPFSLLPSEATSSTTVERLGRVYIYCSGRFPRRSDWTAEHESRFLRLPCQCVIGALVERPTLIVSSSMRRLNLSVSRAQKAVALRLLQK